MQKIKLKLNEYFQFLVIISFIAQTDPDEISAYKTLSCSQNAECSVTVPLQNYKFLTQFW